MKEMLISSLFLVLLYWYFVGKTNNKCITFSLKCDIEKIGE